MHDLTDAFVDLTRDERQQLRLLFANLRNRHARERDRIGLALAEAYNQCVIAVTEAQEREDMILRGIREATRQDAATRRTQPAPTTSDSRGGGSQTV